MIQVLYILLLLISAIGLPVQAKDFYVDPEHGKSQNDGSAVRPWRSLQRVLESGLVLAGDTVFLRSGYHGALVIANRRNERPVTITADRGHRPRLGRIRIRESANWRLNGLFVSPSYGRVHQLKTIVHIGPDVEDVTLEGCRIESATDSSAWSASDWNRKATNGIDADGTRLTLRNNTIRNVNHGLIVHATHSMVLKNLVENFSGDGIRALGSHTAFRSNTIKNCYKVNDNHDDGIQSWSRGSYGQVGTGEVVGVVLSGNRIINYEDPDQPLRCTLQGIGLFDGTFVDWTIENNLVITNHWHGITVMGARNVRVINNTVFDPEPGPPGPAWITITRHKNGLPSEASLIVNNLAQSFNRRGFEKGRFPTGPEGVLMHHNALITDPDVFFEDASAFDFRLKLGSPAIDTGSSEHAPATDITSTPRPAGVGIDLGAFERPILPH